MIGDHYRDKWQNPAIPYTNPYQSYPLPIPNNIPGITQYIQGVSQLEFDALKGDVLEMRELLKRALDYDTKNGEPHCETDDKVALLKAVAKAVGVDLSEVVPKE